MVWRLSFSVLDFVVFLMEGALVDVELCMCRTVKATRAFVICAASSISLGDSW